MADLPIKGTVQTSNSTRNIEQELKQILDQLDANGDDRLDASEVSTPAGELQCNYITEKLPRGSSRDIGLTFERVEFSLFNSGLVQKIRDTICPRINAEYDRDAIVKKIGAQPGRHTSESKILGIHADIFKSYAVFVKNHPAFLKFGNALYNGTPDGSGRNDVAVFKMIPYEQRKDAENVARDLYLQYCRVHDIDSQKQVDFFDEPFRAGVTYTYYKEDEYNVWNKQVLVFNGGILSEEENDYFPAHLVALHELGHIERTVPYILEKIQEEDGINEIATRINDAINADTVYKSIMEISIDEVVDYPEKLSTELVKEGLNVGLLANAFRILKDKHGTVEAALMSPEGMAFVLNYFSDSAL